MSKQFSPFHQSPPLILYSLSSLSLSFSLSFFHSRSVPHNNANGSVIALTYGRGRRDGGGGGGGLLRASCFQYQLFVAGLDSFGVVTHLSGLWRWAMHDDETSIVKRNTSVVDLYVQNRNAQHGEMEKSRLCTSASVPYLCYIISSEAKSRMSLGQVGLTCAKYILYCSFGKIRALKGLFYVCLCS